MNVNVNVDVGVDVHVEEAASVRELDSLIERDPRVERSRSWCDGLDSTF